MRATLTLNGLKYFYWNTCCELHCFLINCRLKLFYLSILLSHLTYQNGFQNTSYQRRPRVSLKISPKIRRNYDRFNFLIQKKYYLVRLTTKTEALFPASWYRKHLRSLRQKCPNMEFFLVCIFPYSDWIPKKYRVSLHIQSECGKIRTRKMSVFGLFSFSDWWRI